jgi:hypothetical protein
MHIIQIKNSLKKKLKFLIAGTNLPKQNFTTSD